MKIEVAVEKSSSNKVKGDLLEDLAEKLLMIQQYEVTKELRNTGAEIDLLCKHKVSQKIVYVECKAYRDKKIDAPTLYKMIGIRGSKEYDEAWLITTSALGKDAKGIVDNEESKETKELSFYTPVRIIEALVDASTIDEISISKKIITKLVGSKNRLGESSLIVTKYGIFWGFEYLSGGSPDGILLTYANNSELVEDVELLEKLQNTDSSYNELNFKKIFSLGEGAVDKYGRYIFEDRYYKSIIDTGVKLTHSEKVNLDIDDVFVFQDLQEVDGEKNISSSKLINLTNDFSKILVFGEDVSGKTTLANKLQREYLSNGLIPVYINAAQIRSSELNKFNGLIKRTIKKHFQNITDDILNKLDSDRLVLIIDDYHLISLNKKSILSLNSILEDSFSKVVLFCNISKKLEIVTNIEFLEAFSSVDFYQIQEYGYSLRDKVISKWISIGQTETIDDQEKHRRVLEISETINTTVGQRFVPTFPIYILTLLQSFEASSARSLQGSAYAEFYNYLITHALGTSGVRPSELHVYISYLSNISFLFFQKGKTEISEKEFSIFHSEHCKKKLIKLTFDKLKETLIRSKILCEEDGCFKFNHSYIYYFFTAKYFSEHITEDFVKSEISKIIEKLHFSEYANIILFLIHFSKSKFIFEKIISEARNVFSDTKCITFKEEEFKNINKLIESEVKLVYQDKTPEEARTDQLEIKDNLESHNGNDLQAYEDKGQIEVDIFSKINLSFKLMDILGQISKNYYGSLDGDIKVEVVSEVYNLGLKSLNEIMLNFEEYNDLLVEQVSEIIEAREIKSEFDVTSITKKIVFDFATMISMGFIAKTANSVASKELYEVIDIVTKKDPTVATDLIEIAINLDFPNGLDSDSILSMNESLKSNNIAKMILKLFVVKHFYKFHVSYDKKQRICEKLNIGIEKQKKMLNRPK